MTHTSTSLPATEERVPPAGPGLVLDQETQAAAAVGPAPRGERWTLPTRVLFRLCVLYFGLYILTTQMYWGFARIVPWITMPYLRLSEPVQRATTHIASSWWGFPLPLSQNGGSGDKPFDWALACATLIVSAAATALWSALDWKRPSYPGVHKWFRLVLRLGLATTMVGYGMAKFYPLQMSYPALTRMLQPYGTFSMMGVLWTKIGASPMYEIFTGAAELLMAILLFIPGLTTIGALVGLAVTTQIWVLNMTYDVPVKLFSFHLMLMCMILLAPDARRLTNFLILKRPADPPAERPLFRNRIGLRIAVVAQLAFGAWMLWNAYGTSKAAYGNSAAMAPRPPLYGVWTIDKMMIDGVERAPLLTDYDRWRRVVVQSPGMILFQRMDETFTAYTAKVDLAASNIALTARSGPAGNLKVEQPAPGKLIMDGDISGKKIRIESTMFDHSRWNMVNTKFRWVQDTPFNR